ncbi:hypothetical protein ACHAPT_007161 [Fusarium lateritium]
MRVSLSLAALLAASLSQAQYLISELSFGHAGRISPPEARGQIPNFALQGTPHMPEVLSNRIILTPLAPGNQRGAVWGQQPLLRNQWIADVDFRANGPDRGRGNLNIWLVRNGPASVGSGSIYTVGKFDGLALVVDTHGGAGGMVRGFLNDGNTDFTRQSNVDELSFGHCGYNYRNLGRPSQIKLRQTSTSFRVEVDGELCFESGSFSIPTGYQFGVTAATPDNPDSFEVFKVVVMADNSDSGAVRNNDPPKQQTPNKNPPNSRGAPPPKREVPEGEYADEDADIFQTSKTQFMDLHNRLQNTNHQLSSLHRTSSRHQQEDVKRHEEVTALIGQLRADMRKLDDITALQTRVIELEKEVKGLRKDLTRKLQSTERSVRDVLSSHHNSLSQAVMASTPGHRFLVLFFLGTQLALVAAYVIYKRRRATMPKKYL